MNTQCSIALDALSILYMLILLFNLKQKRRWEALSRQYCQIVVAICLFLALDILYVSFYGHAGPAARFVLKAAKSLYLVANSAIVWLWGRYLDCTLYGSGYRLQRHRILYTVIFAVNTAAVFVNFFTGFLFEIASDGVFIVQYAAMWAFTLLNYLSMLLASIVVIRNRARLKRESFLTLLLFPLPPLCAEIVQIFFRPFSLICTYAVSALTVFQISQNTTIYTDELTGLANRRMFDETLHKWLSSPKGRTVCCIMLDLDGLKQINDTYGHLAGDRALIAMAEIIRGVKHREMVAARFGGDEFAVLWLSKDGHELPALTQRLEEIKTQANAAKPEHERVSFSAGAFCHRDGGSITAEDFLTQADANMYRSKKGRQPGVKTAVPRAKSGTGDE